MSLGQNLPHDSSYTHVQGLSTFIDDRPFLKNEVFVEYLGSKIAHGELIEIDFNEAKKVKGILGFVTAQDIHHNLWGTINPDQPLLVDKMINHYDEPLCLIVGTDRAAIQQAKKLIKVTTKEKNPIFSIDEAIQLNSFLSDAKIFLKGNPEEGFKKSLNIIEGEFFNGGQEHFYLESQASISYPLENGSIEVHSSSQHPTETQHVVAHALGISLHQVVCVVKRMGGGFGGKESQAAPFAAYAALATQKFRRPARLVLTKDDDMMTTGKRHPYKFFYKVGFDNNGKIKSYQVKMFADAGAYTDLSPSILERAMLHADGAYYLENAHIEGRLCKTHLPSNTAFRGFGGPQGNMCMEHVIELIAHHLQLDSLEVRKINLYQNNNIETPYGQKITHNPLPEILEKLEKSSDYQERRKEIERYNKTNQYSKKGMALTFTKFGIAFTAKFLNQGNALVNLHRDGTVQVSTGATEMGQGVNSKIAQIVANAFGIKYEDVKVMPTSTEKNHNTSPTAASTGSDINGAAALLATDKIKKRLACLLIDKEKNNFNPFKGEEHELNLSQETDYIEFKNNKVKNTKTNFSMELVDLLNLAYINRISMGDYAFYKTPHLGFDKINGKGIAFNYYTNGAAVSEVLIDLLTGESKVLRTDILMDLGRMINPGIDQGQTLGAFIQGMGWVTSEELFYDKNGKLISHSPTTYKIPNIQDTPRDFRINFIENPHNTQNVVGSKAVGEPPFLLSASVIMAIKDAVGSLSKNPVKLNSPATPEAIYQSIKNSGYEF
jgi:xanthine dehydrogenase large subunit